jgi:hypothetical protein
MRTLPAGEHEDFRGRRQAGPRKNNGGPALAADGAFLALAE